MRAKQVVDGGWLLKIERGEEIVASILTFCSDIGIASCALSGIGALEAVEIGYFNRDEKKYIKRKLDGVYELLSLTGNVAQVEGKPMLHAHITLGDPNFNVVGGHLFSGSCAVTGELYLRVFDNAVIREIDHQFDLKLLAL